MCALNNTVRANSSLDYTRRNWVFYIHVLRDDFLLVFAKQFTVTFNSMQTTIVD